MVTCRCEVLNSLSGQAAADYAQQHLDVTRETPGRTTTYRCPDTGLSWVSERLPTGYGDDTRRLRRLRH